MPRRIAIGDIHGCLKTFRGLVEDVIHLTQTDNLYLVGDFIDRGPDSKGVLDYLTQLTADGFHIESVRGNHEEMMLESVEDERFISGWVANGAEKTILSFGLDIGFFLTSETVLQIPEKYLEQIREIPYFIDLPDYIIVHAGINLSIPDPFSDTHAMIWSREMQYDASIVNNKTIIHGHTPTSVEIIRQLADTRKPGLLNIDGGCVYNHYPDLGNLVGLDMDTRELFVQKNIE